MEGSLELGPLPLGEVEGPDSRASGGVETGDDDEDASVFDRFGSRSTIGTAEETLL